MPYKVLVTEFFCQSIITPKQRNTKIIFRYEIKSVSYFLKKYHEKLRNFGHLVNHILLWQRQMLQKILKRLLFTDIDR